MIGYQSDRVKYFFKGFFTFVGFEDDELGQFIENVIEFDFVFVFIKVFVVGKVIF